MLYVVEVWRGPPHFVQQVARELFIDKGEQLFAKISLELDRGNLVDVFEVTPINAPSRFDLREKRKYGQSDE
jgi:hypothetical protein